MDGELWHTAWCLLQSGEEHELGSTHQFRASLAFTTFALEAYLNHIGAHALTSWSTIERKLPPLEKLALLCEIIGVSLNWSTRPWQTATLLVRYRNAIAHGRGERLVEEYEDHPDFYQTRFYEPALTEWEKFATRENALRAREDVADIAQQLHSKGHDPDPYPFFLGSQSASASAPEKS